MWRKSSEGKPSSPATQPPFNPTGPGSSAPLTPHRESSGSFSGTLSDGSRLTQGLVFRGDFSGTSDLYIDGALEGNIRLAQSNVTIGPNAHVQAAELIAREISVHGSLKGNLRANDRIMLGPTSRVRGNLASRRIHIEEGASFSGKVEMDSGKASSALAAGRPAENKEKELDSVLSTKQEETK